MVKIKFVFYLIFKSKFFNFALHLINGYNNVNEFVNGLFLIFERTYLSLVYHDVVGVS